MTLGERKDHMVKHGQGRMQLLIISLYNLAWSDHYLGSDQMRS